MKKVILVLTLLVFVSSCSKQNTQLANPASVYCEEQGGTVKMQENDMGQYGICVLPYGIECEEWAYYRGECP